MIDATDPVAKRQRIERLIVSTVVKSALAYKWLISINTGGETILKRCDDCDSIMNSIMSVDDEQLIFYDITGVRKGWIRLVYGNDGFDVIADYSSPIEFLLEDAIAVADIISFWQLFK